VIAFTKRAAGVLVSLALVSCDSEKSREGAMQFAYSWSQTIKTLGLAGLANYQGVRQLRGQDEQTRQVVRAECSQKVNKAADELDEMIFYVSRSLADNVEANFTAIERDPAATRIPLTFPKAALNARLGLDANGGDLNAERAVAGLRQKIVEFTRTARVEKELASRLAAGGKEGITVDSAFGQKDSNWTALREEMLSGLIQQDVLRRSQRKVIEKLAKDSKAAPGFEGAEWLMSRAEVRAVRPNAALTEDGGLQERMEWLGRSASVKYGFGYLGLLHVIVTFSDYASLETYEKTRSALESSYGPMPAAGPGAGFSYVSNYKKSLFSIQHGLRASNTEQVVFEKTTF